MSIIYTVKQVKNYMLYHGAQIILAKYGRSRLEVFCKKAVLKNFAKFTRKHLCQSLLFNKVAGLSPATLLKKDSGTGVFL